MSSYAVEPVKVVESNKKSITINSSFSPSKKFSLRRSSFKGNDSQTKELSSFGKKTNGLKDKIRSSMAFGSMSFNFGLNNNKIQSFNHKDSDLEECTEESHPKVQTVDEGYLQRLLKLSPSAMDELSKISTLEFNIFRIQLETSQNELTTTISYLLAKEQIF